MKSLGFKIVLFLSLIAVNAFSQYRLSGLVTSSEDSSALRGCAVYLSDGNLSAISDARGRFVFEDLPNGTHTLHFLTEEFQPQTIHINISNADQFIRASLNRRSKMLEEVKITDAQSGFGFTRMRSVENTGIYEGKKTEVIIPEQLVANTATNNARQIYSRVAGLNIWENDGAGLQLSIGGRGLDPNRTSNFNARQNGYDISADALGYPESYYTPPIEGVGKIQIVRGAASLQYGTQFGGLINFVMKKPATDKKIEVTARQTFGSFRFYNAFTSVSGTVKKLSYYTFFQYKTGDGWRDNSKFDSHTLYANLNYALSSQTKITLDFTKMGYLAQQPGGLTDAMFINNPRQTNRERNWFDVNWNLLALHFDHKFNSSSEFNLRIFGLSAHRYSVGFRPNRVATVDDNGERDLIKGKFTNWGAEARYLKRYSLGKVKSVALIGTRYYYGFNHSTQGFGSNGKAPDFNFVNPGETITYDYEFPNRNISFFTENIFYLTDKLSVTPGVRFEYINTKAEGYYGTIYKDLAGNVIDKTKTNERANNARQFLLGGIGINYRPTPFVDVYSNLSQNYRSITFSDMRIANPSSEIDPNLQDEKGHSFDLGVRSEQTMLFNYDVSLFYLNYQNRIGEVLSYDANNRVVRRRGNIGSATIQGVEAYGEADILALAFPKIQKWSGVFFNNIAFINSKYNASELTGVEGNEVEFVPRVNLKSGVRLGYNNFKASFQYTHLSEQFTDATNAAVGDVSAVIGIIPSYSIMDVSFSYHFSKFRVEASINNLADEMYFTRRATGYPGPGILPSDGRGYFLTLQVKI
ncbi:MAG: TonB-dependent receptor [Chryseolinea sp.]